MGDFLLDRVLPAVLGLVILGWFGKYVCGLFGFAEVGTVFGVAGDIGYIILILYGMALMAALATVLFIIFPFVAIRNLFRRS